MHGDIVTASYNGEVYDPVRVIRPDGWGWMIVHWGIDDSFSSIRTADILGRSSKPWERDEHAEDVEIDF